METLTPAAREELMRTVAQNLRRARVKQRLTQNEVARVLDIQPMQVSKWENGVVSPHLVNFYQLAQLYSVPTDLLFVRDHPSLPPTQEEAKPTKHRQASAPPPPSLPGRRR